MSSQYGVIFDMDGVLVDSYQAHFESWRLMAHEIGRTMSEQAFATTFGRKSAEIIAAHWGADLLTPQEISRFDERKEALYRDLVAGNFPAMEGARDLIVELHNVGFGLAIGSSGPVENVALALIRLNVEAMFQARVTGADVTRGKPDPEVFLLAARRLGLEPRFCAVIEDAPVGIAAANAAGMTSIALLSTGHTEAGLRAANLIVRSLRELSAERIAGLIMARNREPGEKV